MTRRRPAPPATSKHSAAAWPITMPIDWSPEQALAVFTILDELRERIWELYGRRIQQVLREQRCITTNSAAHTINDADVPF